MRGSFSCFVCLCYFLMYGPIVNNFQSRTLTAASSYFCVKCNPHEKVLLLILFLIFISVDSERDSSLKRNSASMTCVSSSNSTSLGRECDINGAVGSDQVDTFLYLIFMIIQTKAGCDFVQFLGSFGLLNFLRCLAIWDWAKFETESNVWISLNVKIHIHALCYPHNNCMGNAKLKLNNLIYWRVKHCTLVCY